jgi:hypothetical protein
MTIDSPAAGDDFLFFRAERDLIVTGIDCIVNAATSVAVLVKDCDANGGSCVNIEASITCAATNTTESGAIDVPNVGAGTWLRIDPGTVTGTPGHLSVCVNYRENPL